MSRQFTCLIALSCAIANAAAAVPLTYSVISNESNVSARASVEASIDVSPDFTEGVLNPAGQFPLNETMNGFSNTQPSPLSHLIADVGLPGNFADGANGITFSELVIHAFNVPGQINLAATNPLPPIPLDNSPVGIPVLITASASVTSLQITLNAPFSSALTPHPVNPDEWLWASTGPVDVTISGTLLPVLAVQLQLPVAIPPTPFSQNVQIPLFGTFSAVPAGTRVNVGIASDALHDQDLSLPPIHEELDLLDLGLVTLSFDLDTLLLGDISSSVVYRNATPIPEPGTALLVGLGLVGLAAVRRR